MLNEYNTDIYGSIMKLIVAVFFFFIPAKFILIQVNVLQFLANEGG